MESFGSEKEDRGVGGGEGVRGKGSVPPWAPKCFLVSSCCESGRGDRKRICLSMDR